MSLFFVQRHIKNLSQKLKQLQLTIQKINLVSKKIETNTTNKINSVCWAEVKLKHTSEIMVNLGAGYFLETTKEQALSIADRRKNYIKQNISKLEKIKDGLLKKQGIEKGKGYEKRVIEKNEDGQDVFEIMQFPYQQNLDQTKNQQQIIKEYKEAKPQKPTHKKEVQNPQESKSHGQQIQSKPKEEKKVSFENIPAPVPAPKRISKFKQQRQQQRKL